MGETPTKRRPAVEARIEEATMRLATHQSPDEISFVEVAAQAHCSLQTLYRYYGSMEDLWLACAGRVLKHLGDRIIDHLQAIESYKDRMRKVFWLMLDFFERHDNFIKLFMETVHFQRWMNDISFKQPEVSRVVLDMIAEGQASGILTNEVDKVAILDFIYGVVFRFVQMHQIRRIKQSNAQRSNALFEMLWRAIANPHPHPHPPREGKGERG
ncbi:hypothetical protein WS67_16880 [Burkholderia singularis]|uniref:HTH tetR-type domain-containing protein n=2 Tax=Burkholderiaceae TaxID=119060 RepID=A0A118DN79_9BURK|nr:TetR/AcrR family transcriptional regulator [Burkholderia singularis]KVE26044.1 hypothetical protein WS67_16880 [Burkholderia singularis]